MPMPVLCSDLEMVEKYTAQIEQNVREKLIQKYWPGALTIILPANTKLVPKLVTGGTNTVGVRIPRHRMLLRLIAMLGVPLLGPSANFHSQKTPYNTRDVDPGLIALSDYVLPGKAILMNHSTVINTTVKPWKILREGRFCCYEQTIY